VYLRAPMAAEDAGLAEGWFVGAGGEQAGPMSADDARAAAAKDAASLVWHASMPAWAELKDSPLSGEAAAGGWVFARKDGSGPSAPASAEALADAMERGELGASTLVWRAGMPGWVPFDVAPGLASEVSAVLESRDKIRAVATSSARASEARAKKRQRSAAAPAGGNPWVYVTGLPPDATVAELVSHLRPVGAVQVDPGTGRPMVRLYRQRGEGAKGALKGDASVCFANEASVPLALQQLDGVALRQGAAGGGAGAAGWPLAIAQAEFTDKAGHTVSGRTAVAGAADGGGGGGGGAAKRAKGGAAVPSAADVPFDAMPRRRRVVAAAQATQRARAAWDDSVSAGEPDHGIRGVMVFGLRREGEDAGAASLRAALEARLGSFGPLDGAVSVNPSFVADAARTGAREALHGAGRARFQRPGAAEACVRALQPDASAGDGGEGLVAVFDDGTLRVEAAGP